MLEIASDNSRFYLILEQNQTFVIIISPDAVWGYNGFGLVAPQVTCERDNSKTNLQNFMKLCRSLDISM